MEQRKEIVNTYVSKGLAVTQATSIAGISKSSYYYKPNGRRKGKKPEGFTLKGQQLVPNDQVVREIEEMLTENDFIDYGYHRTTQALKKLGYTINHKKVYRLMKEKQLLYWPIKAGRLAKRGFVQYKVPKYEHPFATVEMDIKYLYIHGQRRNALLLTLIDTFSRSALEWALNFSIKSSDVAALIKKFSQNSLVQPYLTKSKIMVRSDNGPQFIAKKLSEAIQDLPLNREFIHPATPQENAHIESFHNTLTKLVVNKFEFKTINEAKDILAKFYNTYNNKRIMDSILYCSPIEFLDEWKQGNVVIGEKNKKQKFFFRERQLEKPTDLSSEVLFNCPLQNYLSDN